MSEETQPSRMTETPRSDAARIIEQDSCYGSYTGGDPRTFSPDGECCTEKEAEAHKKACELWDEMEAKGQIPTPEACPSGWTTLSDGTPCHVLRCPYGLGVQTYEVETDTVPLDFARELERHLTTALKRIKILREALKELHEKSGEKFWVLAEEDGDRAISFDIGQAYQESELCEKICKALNQSQTGGKE